MKEEQQKEHDAMSWDDDSNHQFQIHKKQKEDNNNNTLSINLLGSWVVSVSIPHLLLSLDICC